METKLIVGNASAMPYIRDSEVSVRTFLCMRAWGRLLGRPGSGACRVRSSRHVGSVLAGGVPELMPRGTAGNPACNGAQRLTAQAWN